MRPIASFACRFSLAASLAVAMTACSGTGIPGTMSSTTGGVNANAKVSNGLVRPQTSAHGAALRGWISPAAKKSKNLMYWGNYYSSTITIYSNKGVNGKEEGQITTGLSNPERLFVDKKRNVYATNLGNNTITAYKPGATSPFLTISSGVSNPTGITVDAAGTIYCANVGNDTITVYPRGQTTPSLTISLPPSLVPEYLATDASDNLYASVGLYVYEFAPGSSTGKNLGLAVGSPAAVEVDRKGNLIVLDQSDDDIDYIPAGQTQPSKQISVTSGFPYALSLSANEKELYVSVSANSGPFIIQSVAYPNGSTPANKFTTNAGDWPIAVSPDNALGG